MSSKIKKNFDGYWWALIVIGVITIILIICYLTIFNGGLSDEHNRWGEFGNFLGGLTGLIAFVGVLITLRQSRKQVIGSEERATFFKMLDIVDISRNKISIKKVDFKNEILGVRREVSDDEQQRLSGDIAFEQIIKDAFYHLQEAIIDRMPEYVSEDDLTYNLIPKSLYGTPAQDHFEKMKEGIEEMYKKFSRTSTHYSSPIIENSVWRNIAFQSLDLLIKQKKYDAINELFNKVGDTINSLYRNSLGPHFRNVFLILDTVSKFTTQNNYARIFRSQLSKNELIVLFFNAFSISATPETRRYYRESGLFNNLAWQDVGIFIRNPYYIDENRLKKLYNSADDYYNRNEELRTNSQSLEY